MVSSDWLPSYIKATRPVLEIFKKSGYFPDSPCILSAGAFDSDIEAAVSQARNKPEHIQIKR
jgi:hypothetical protein